MSRGDEEEEDDPEARVLADAERLGINLTNFQGVLDDAIEHAAVAARRDRFPVPPPPPAPAPPQLRQPWIPIGPRNIGGRVRVMAQHPTNPAILYAGSAIGGVWKTENSGDTWTALDRFQPPNPPDDVRQSLPIGALAIAPGDPLSIYVGTGEPVVAPDGFDYHYPGLGLYRSTDGGTIFQQLDHVDTGTIRARRYERILVDPHDPNRCWMACSKGLWRQEPGAPPSLVQDAIDAAGAPAAASQHASDVAIDFGPRGAAVPATYTVYVALRDTGIYRATFETAGSTYTALPSGAHWTKLDKGLDEKEFNRIKIALCASRPEVLYAVFGLKDRSASRVYRSMNRGDEWKKTAARPDDDGKQATYDLLLEVHPNRPEIVFHGSVELFRTVDGGDNWTKVLNWLKYDRGDRAQHADQHAFLFDSLDTRKIWVGNDGGISMSRDLGLTWRKRSHGILAAQFYDVTVHPRFPFISGGGLQDNGSWVGFGGPTWFHLFGGDGGAIGFDPTTPRRLIVTWQGGKDTFRGAVRVNIRDSTEPFGEIKYQSPLPDIPEAAPPAKTPLTKLRSFTSDMDEDFEAGHTATFTGIVEHHPANADHALLGRQNAAYLTTDGTTFGHLANLTFATTPCEVSALTYAPGDPDNEWWVGTSKGEAHTTPDAGTNWNNRSPPGIGTAWVSRIAVHPANDAIVALVTGGRTGRVYLSNDRGVTWREISGRIGPPVSPAADQLCPSPITSVVFDPESPAGANDLQTLYVGTMAGVYVCRNAPPPSPPPAPAPPVWRTLNDGLPLTLVYDIVAVTVRDGGGNLTRKLLRAATFGRSIYDCDLGGTPDVRLHIRKTPIDDGRIYEGAALLAEDPRLAAGTALVFDSAFDIRVDAPPYSFFEEKLDGVEFDEDLRHDKPVAGERNMIYVQIHNSGTQRANGVDVHVFFADSPGTPPDLPADFWTAGFPAGAAPWLLAGSATVDEVGPGQPIVARIEWLAPADLGARVALLAVCTHAGDPVAVPAPPILMDPTDPASLIRAERRAALRITDAVRFQPDVFVRDGVDDEGSPGAVAWGARSGDIIVVQTAPGDPATEFADVTASRAEDRVKGGVDNFVFVRVHNRRNVPLDATVDLYAVPFARMHLTAEWRKIADAVPVTAIPAQGSGLTAQITWPAADVADPDPTPDHPFKMYVLIAIIDAADDTKPDHTTITSIDTFWRFFLRPEQANNAAVRAIRFEPA